MKLWNKIKDVHGSRIFVFGKKIYELRKEPKVNSTYLLGIKVRSKRPGNLINEDTRIAAEDKIRALRVNYNNLPKEEKHILCFDCLYDPMAEAIDAWTLFEYLQSHNIPSRYALLTSNPLYRKLKEENKLTDILPVENEFDLLRLYPEEIAQSRLIFFSFPFTCSRVLFELPSCPFIFIEHGVTYLKDWSIYLYTEGGASECNYILTPSQLTKNLYTEKQLMLNRMFESGLPRWDKLTPHTPEKEQHNIFIFFTWRTTFIHDKRLLDTYTERIASFVEKLHELIANQSEITINIALHHALLLHNPRYNLNRFNHARIIPTNEISGMIQNTDLFLTDYSSVCFDLMYRDVPTIFYRFDSDLTYSNNMDNEAARSAAEKDSELYNCFYTMEDALHKIEHYIHAGFRIEESVRHRNEEIFWQRSHNCRRLMKLANAIPTH